MREVDVKSAAYSFVVPSINAKDSHPTVPQDTSSSSQHTCHAAYVLSLIAHRAFMHCIYYNLACAAYLSFGYTVVKCPKAALLHLKLSGSAPTPDLHVYTCCVCILSTASMLDPCWLHQPE